MAMTMTMFLFKAISWVERRRAVAESDVVTRWTQVVAPANLSCSFTILIDYMYILYTSKCRIKIGVEWIYFQSKRITFECATLRILHSSINLFVWTKKKKKKTACTLCSAHGCKWLSFQCNIVHALWISMNISDIWKPRQKDDWIFHQLDPARVEQCMALWVYENQIACR